MSLKVYISQNRVFMLALLLSLVWHTFWLSAVTVVISSDHEKGVKFSKVAFLGPILGSGSPEFRVEPGTRSFLEKRYMKNVGQIPFRERATLPISPGSKYEGPENDALSAGRKLDRFIDEAISGPKLEPVHGFE